MSNNQGVYEIKVDQLQYKNSLDRKLYNALAKKLVRGDRLHAGKTYPVKINLDEHPELKENLGKNIKPHKGIVKIMVSLDQNVVVKQSQKGDLVHLFFKEVLGKGGFGIVFKAGKKLRYGQEQIKESKKVVKWQVLKEIDFLDIAENGKFHLGQVQQLYKFIRDAYRENYFNLLNQESLTDGKHPHLTFRLNEDKQLVAVLSIPVAPGKPLSTITDSPSSSAVKRFDIAIAVAKELERLEKMKVAHLDLKPGNIMIEEDVDGQIKARLVDFGLAKAYQEQSGNRGTMGYIAPELFQGNVQQVDHNLDRYSMGVILYLLFTGEKKPQSYYDLKIMKNMKIASNGLSSDLNQKVKEQVGQLYCSGEEVASRASPQQVMSVFISLRAILNSDVSDHAAQDEIFNQLEKIHALYLMDELEVEDIDYAIQASNSLDENLILDVLNLFDTEKIEKIIKRVEGREDATKLIKLCKNQKKQFESQPQNTKKITNEDIEAAKAKADKPATSMLLQMKKSLLEYIQKELQESYWDRLGKKGVVDRLATFSIFSSEKTPTKIIELRKLLPVEKILEDKEVDEIFKGVSELLDKEDRWLAKQGRRDITNDFYEEALSRLDLIETVEGMLSKNIEAEHKKATRHTSTIY